MLPQGKWSRRNGKHGGTYQRKGIGRIACNDPRDAMAVMYRNAQLFLETRETPDAGLRRNAIGETYEEVCRFMRYYHGLAKKTGRVKKDAAWP